MSRQGRLWGFGACVAAVALLSSGAMAGSALLLGVSKGQMPNDTTADPQVSLAEQAELGGAALKVVFPQGASFGETRPKIGDWTPFRTLKFDAFNPSDKPLSLTLCVRHKGTTGYQSRADTALMLKPGKSSIALGLGDMANVDGSRPDLSGVKQWYVTCEAANTTVYFGDFTLEGEGAAAPAATPAAPAPAASGGPVRITGKVGDMAVDLTVTGLGPGAAAPAPAAGQPPAPAPAPAAGARATLLGISKGSMPNDTNGDPQVALDDKAELGGVCLKVTFAKGASFGMSRAGLKDWRGYSTLKFAALNPANTPVTIEFTIKHEGSKTFGTRVDKEVVLAPGKNEVSIPIAGAANNDGSAANLSAVRQWYIACNAEATVFFGDFVLEGGK
ncbi:MAG TPA: hypothetical protein VNE39_25790 [Planctomycetota bacterium]|nr:hypothetical protein [Planctomycetota bacterium]